MSKFRESTVSKCEKSFVLKCLSEDTRLDKRAFDESREITIIFGSDWGSCYVSLGKTKVCAQVSCEVQTPKSTRPNEGILYINVELSPLAAAHFEAGRQSDLSVQLNRMLEKCIKDSKAVDLESLCIKVNEKAWAFRVDINVLNYEGNILDCASIAALSALAHFRRPDVSWDGEEVTIFSYEEKDSIPTVIHHYPVCLSYAIYNDGDIILADPNLLEEEVSDALFSIALNGYNELCGFHLGGSALIAPETILETTNRASRRAKTIIDIIKKSLKEDEAKRDSKIVCFRNSSLFNASATTAAESSNLSKYLDQWTSVKSNKKQKSSHQQLKTETEEQYPASIEQIAPQSAVLVPPLTNVHKWTEIESESSEEEAQEQEKQRESKSKSIEMDTDSEEEATIVLNANREMQKHKRKMSRS